MAETIDAIVVSLAVPKPSARTLMIADSLVHHAAAFQAMPATPGEIAAGFRLAADRVAAWVDHRDWPRLCDDRRR